MRRLIPGSVIAGEISNWISSIRRTGKERHIHVLYGFAVAHGSAWTKQLHLAYLGTLAQEGFVVASVEYRTSNEGTHPMQLCDIKAAIRYLRAYAKRYRINSEKFGDDGRICRRISDMYGSTGSG